jgi:hypothetical protein
MNLNYVIIYKCIFFFIILINFSQQQEHYCNSKHTDIYNKRGGPDNSNNYYFNPNTFSQDKDICKIYTPYEYKEKLIEENIKCVGDWCSDEHDWGNATYCKKYNNASCYQVNRIIPKFNYIPDIKNCETSISGNYIMNYENWNENLGNSFYDEKRIVYGFNIFYKAYSNIYFCCHKEIQVEDFPKELTCEIEIIIKKKDSYNYGWLIGYCILGIFFGILATITCGFITILGIGPTPIDIPNEEIVVDFPETEV